MRERLTITLKQDLLNALDHVIDGQKLRNRSHAIEYFLSRALGSQAVKVLILAGGKPVDFNKHKLPKAMVKIAGKPLLEHTLKKLKMEKFSEVVISVGEGGEQISNYFKDGKSFGLKLTYLKQQPHTQGTAGALLEAKEFFSDDSFLLMYGDVLSEIDYSELLEFHRTQKSAVCTMALTSVETPKMWGMAKLNGGKIISFEEKPKKSNSLSHLVNAGIYVMEPEIFKYIKVGENKLESGVFPRLAHEAKLAGYAFESLWLDINNSAVYKQAVREMAK
jgi:mannose-1-phosphate guanylyltransferase